MTLNRHTSYICTTYERQKAGVNKTNSVNISKRPNNMAMINTHLLISLIDEKLAATSPNPGPRLLIQAATAVKAVMSSIPAASSNNMQITNTAA